MSVLEPGLLTAAHVFSILKSIRPTLTKILITLLTGLLAGSSIVRATDMQWLTLRDGLAGISVHAIHEDPSGQMWIGTSNGITLYNGMSLKNYALPRTANELPYFCYDLDLDRDGNVWVATRVGIYRLLRHDNDFERVAPQISQAEAVLCVGDTVFVGTRSGLYYIDGKGRVKTVNVTDGEVHDNSSVRCLRLWQGNLWLSMRECLYEIRLKEQMKSVCHPLPNPSGLSRFDAAGGKLFVGTKNQGLFVYQPQDHSVRHIEGVGNVVTDVHACDDTTVCVSIDGGGAVLIDACDERVVKHFGTRKESDCHLPTDAAYTYIRSREGLNWIGMFQSGLVHDNYEHTIFTTYAHGNFSTKNMKVTAAYAYGAEWLIATTGGFWYINEETGQHEYFRTADMGMLLLKTFCRYGDYYYIASYDGGLLRLHAGNHTLSRLPGCAELEFASILKMVIDPRNQLWLVTSEGLYRIEADASIHRYTEKNSRLPMGANSLCFDWQGNGWIGAGAGLCLYLAREDVFKTEGFPATFFNTVPGLKVTGDGDTILAWNQTKLYSTNCKMTRFGEIDIPDYVLAERYFDVASNGDGSLWVVTEKGLFLIDRQHESTIHYTPSSGLHGTVITPGTLAVNDQYVWVGTDEGLMIADKRTLRRRAHAKTHQPLIIDHLVVGDNLMGKGETMRVNDRKEIPVSWNFASQKLILMPTLLDFSKHDGDIYEYRLDNGPWVSHPLGDAIREKSLSLGGHTLQMRLSGMDTTIATYTVHVYPSKWFYVEFVLFLLTIALLGWWHTWRLKTKALLHEHVETEEALIEEMKNETASNHNEPGEQSPAGNEAKYHKHRINEKELAALFCRMDELVKEKRPYLDTDLKMSDIAGVLGVSPSMLSQVFTLYVKEPYYDYINKYRLEAFKQLIREGRHKQFTITALYEQCGFKKTSFFSTFRKVEGTTPTEWIRTAK